METLKLAKAEVFGDEPVKLVPVTEGGIRMDVDFLKVYPMAFELLVHAFRKYAGLIEPIHPAGSETLYLDIETHNEGLQWGMSPEEFFRLGQFAWGSGEVVLTTDYQRVIDQIRKARVTVAQNGHPFDFSVLFGKDSIEPLMLADQARLLDTMVLAASTLPAPQFYTNRKGHKRVNADKPGNAGDVELGWFSLDNQSFQLGLDGKTESLQELAKEFNPPKTLVRELDYGLIPVDDARFRSYAEQDVVALREYMHSLLSIRPMVEYDWREQLSAAIDAQNSRNGFRVDIERATKRRDELQARKDEVLRDLERRYEFPTGGKKPWASAKGKEAIFAALADAGITKETVPDWTRTDTGNLSLGGKVLLEITAGTPAEELGEALAELAGQRSLAQLALDSVREDGFAHPQITALQRSGRKSTTKPGLTVWSARGDKSIEKAYFIPDSPDQILVEFDYSQADARIVAALSGDKAFKERFAEGVDAHELTGRVVFGNEVYDSDPEKYRQNSKALGHAWGYRAGSKKLAFTSKQPLEVAEQFVNKMGQAYPDVLRWQNKVTAEGEGGFVVNDWGRKMVIERGHAYTQAPAMYGQSGTRELMVDALIRMLRADVRIIRGLKAQVHDALVFSLPRKDAHWMVPLIQSLMETTWEPSDGTGQEIHFPAAHGPLADNWMEANH